MVCARHRTGTDKQGTTSVILYLVQGKHGYKTRYIRYTGIYVESLHMQCNSRYVSEEYRACGGKPLCPLPYQQAREYTAVVALLSACCLRMPAVLRAVAQRLCCVQYFWYILLEFDLPESRRETRAKCLLLRNLEFLTFLNSAKVSIISG